MSGLPARPGCWNSRARSEHLLPSSLPGAFEPRGRLFGASFPKCVVQKPSGCAVRAVWPACTSTNLAFAQAGFGGLPPEVWSQRGALLTKSKSRLVITCRKPIIESQWVSIRVYTTHTKHNVSSATIISLTYQNICCMSSRFSIMTMVTFVVSHQSTCDKL